MPNFFSRDGENFQDNSHEKLFVWDIERTWFKDYFWMYQDNEILGGLFS